MRNIFQHDNDHSELAHCGFQCTLFTHNLLLENVLMTLYSLIKIYFFLLDLQLKIIEITTRSEFLN